MEGFVSPFRKDLLNGKVVLVTGGGSGINFGIAEAFAEHGCHIVLMGRRKNVLEESSAILEKKYGAQVLFVPGDVRNYDDCVHVIDDTIKRFGRLDVLVNGAAGNFLVKAENLSSNGFKSVISIDLLGTFNMCRSAFQALKNNPDGDTLIINITATIGYTATPYQIHASAAKMGVESLTRSIALEWGEYGIRSVAIAPGPVQNTQGINVFAEAGNLDQIIKTIPVGRLGTSYEIGLISVFLTTKAASWITGICIVADGGQFLFKYPLGFSKL